MSLNSIPAHYGTTEFDEALQEFPPHVQDILRLSAKLCAEAGITVPTNKVDFEKVIRSHEIARDFAIQAGLQVIELPADPENGKPYPYLMVTFQENNLNDPAFTEAIALIGHTDVVPPTTRPPDGEDQFNPYLKDGDLFARGAADMKTVVATDLVWMAERQKKSGPKPPFITMISSCEENGSDQANHTEAALDHLKNTYGLDIRFAVVGERTGELEWMDPSIQVGPICEENRSWRWMEWEATPTTPSKANRDTLFRIAGIIGEGREHIQTLNNEIKPERAAKQPGLRSGFVNPYVLIGSDKLPETPTPQLQIKVAREKGTSTHSAAVSAANNTLIENFESFVKKAEFTFGTDNIHLSELVIGEQGNFNSTDGTGKMRITISGNPETITQWTNHQSTELTQNNLTISIETPSPETIYQGPTIMGIDIRELLEHKKPVETWIGKIRQELESSGIFRDVLSRPSWKCPESDDLNTLKTAYKTVIGEPSPNLVKLHGNDGGALAARQQISSAQMAELGLATAVVFGQVGRNPHGKGEFHRGSSIAPYWEILEKWADSY